MRAGRSDDRGSIPGGNYFFDTMFRPALGPTHSPTKYVTGTLFLGVKHPRLEADHSPPSSAELNLHSHVIAWCFVKHRDNCTFTFYPSNYTIQYTIFHLYSPVALRGTLHIQAHHFLVLLQSRLAPELYVVGTIFEFLCEFT
jgi:hypothetical protein